MTQEEVKQNEDDEEEYTETEEDEELYEDEEETEPLPTSWDTEIEEEETEEEPLPIFSVKGLNYNILRKILALAYESDRDNYPLRISQDGLSSRFMDRSRIEMVDVTIPKAVLNNYEVTSEGLIELLLMPNEVKMLTKKKLQRIDMASDGSKVHTTLHDMLYDLNIDMNAKTSKEYLSEPQVPFRSSFSMYVGILQKILKDLEATYLNENKPYVKITTDQEHVSFTHNLGGTVLRREDPGVSLLNSPEIQSASYIISPILRFLRIVQPTTVLIEFAHNLPMRITTEIDGVKFTYWLAARVEEESTTN